MLNSIVDGAHVSSFSSSSSSHAMMAPGEGQGRVATGQEYDHGNPSRSAYHLEEGMVLFATCAGRRTYNSNLSSSSSSSSSLSTGMKEEEEEHRKDEEVSIPDSSYDSHSSPSSPMPSTGDYEEDEEEVGEEMEVTKKMQALRSALHVFLVPSSSSSPYHRYRQHP